MNAKQFVIMLAGFAGPLSGNAVLALVPTLGGIFGVSPTTILVSVPVFMLPFATLQIFSGALSDVNRRLAIYFGFSSYAAGALLCTLTVNFEIFLAGRLMQGIGFAFVNPVITAILGDIVPPQARGSAMGILGASTTAGIALGPLLAGAAAGLDWRLAFYAFATLAIVVIVLFSIVFAGFEFHTSYGINNIVSKLIATVNDRNMEALMACGFLTFFSYIAAMSFISAELSALNFDDATIGLVISSAGVAGIVSSPIAGRLADRLGRRATALIGYAIVASALALLSVADRANFPIDVALFFLLGIGTAHVWSSLLTLSVEVLPNLRGTATSLFNSARFFGYASSPVVLAPVFVNYGMSIVMAITSATSIICAAIVLLIVSELKK